MPSAGTSTPSAQQVSRTCRMYSADGLALPPPVLAPPLSVALFAVVLLGDRVAVLPVGELQLSDSSAVGDGRE